MLGRKEDPKDLARVSDRPLARNVWFDPWEDMDRLFDDFFRRGTTRPFASRGFDLAAAPSVDITDAGDHLLIKADMPGVPKENVKVEIQNDMLGISADVAEEHKDEGKDYVRRERRCTSFHRSFVLPDDVDREGIVANMKDGVLKVTIPRKEAKGSKKVEVKVD